MQPRTSFRSPLFGLTREPRTRPKARFRHRLLTPIALIALIAFVLLDVVLVLRLVRDEPTRPDARPVGEVGGSQPGASSDPLGTFDETGIGTPTIPSDRLVDRVGDRAGQVDQQLPPATSGSVATTPTSGSSTSSDTSGTGDGSGSTEPSESPAPEPDESGGGPGGSGSGGGDSGGGDGSGGGGGGGGG